MIQLHGAGKRFGHKLLFEDLDWLITPKDRVGLVGANGTGKSTLLKVLAGIESLDYGIADQHAGAHGGLSPAGRPDALRAARVFAECMRVFAESARHGRGAGDADASAWPISIPRAQSIRPCGRPLPSRR